MLTSLSPDKILLPRYVNWSTNFRGLPLLADTPAQAEFLIHNQQQEARRNSFYVKADKTELMCFKQNEVIPTLSHIYIYI